MVGTDVFFEITDPEELAYTYKIRPAQDFGTTFNETFSVKNIPLVLADPSFACDTLFNSEQLEGHVALVERGYAYFFIVLQSTLLCNWYVFFFQRMQLFNKKYCCRESWSSGNNSFRL